MMWPGRSDGDTENQDEETATHAYAASVTRVADPVCATGAVEG
jgi:hypothetical protein